MRHWPRLNLDCEKAAIAITTVSRSGAADIVSENLAAEFVGASLNKILIALCAADHFQFAMTPRISIDLRSVAGIANSQRLASTKALPLEAVIRLAIRDSDNQAANALIEASGIDRINRFGRMLGLSNTRIHGFYRDDAAGAPCTTSAEDMRRLCSSS